MLEHDRNYSIKEIENLKDLVIATYVIIDNIYQKVTPTYIKNRRNINDSVLSDSEIITISIIGELLTIDSEKAWLGFCKKNMRDLFLSFVTGPGLTEFVEDFMQSLRKSGRRSHD